MSDPVIITIPHHLGKDEANGDLLEFSLSAMGQKASGTALVLDKWRLSHIGAAVAPPALCRIGGWHTCVAHQAATGEEAPVSVPARGRAGDARASGKCPPQVTGGFRDWPAA